MTTADVANEYRKRAAWAAQHAQRSRQRADRIASLRILTFILLILTIAWTWTTHSTTRPVAALSAAASAAAFIALVIAHRHEQLASRRYDETRALNELGEHRVAREWSALPTPPTPPIPPSHAYATDLDITGHASLLKLLDVVSAAPGRLTLLAWLLTLAPTIHEIRHRQASIRELTPLHELREELGVLARLAGNTSPEAIDQFLDWCQNPPWLLAHPSLLWTARLITALTIAFGFPQLATIVTWPIWMISATAGLIITGAIRGRIGDVVRLANLRATTLRHHAAMLARLSTTRFTAPRLTQIQAQIAAGGGAPRQLAALE